MARKNLLKNLMNEAKTPETETVSAPTQRYRKGAIGAVSQQIEELKSRSIVELDPFTIKAGGLHDRLEHDEPAHKSLMDSIATYGQQVPVLVRPDPDTEGQFRIVYGRRRVLALRDLGTPVRAMIRDLDDAEAILAQGQENSARRDLSFIERVNFARQMVEAGYERKIIADALSTDKTLISRMLKVADALPVSLIEHIGAAHGIGRDRWIGFAQRWTESGADMDEALDMLAVTAGATSDARFEALNTWLVKSTDPAAPPKPKKPASSGHMLRGPNGSFGRMARSGNVLRIEITVQNTDGFDDWLAVHLEDIHREWLKDHSGE